MDSSGKKERVWNPWSDEIKMAHYEKKNFVRKLQNWIQN